MVRPARRRGRLAGTAKPLRGMHASSARSRLHPVRFALAAAGVVAATALAVALPAAANGAPPASGPKPTIVLVHGAFADASGWNDVTERLQKRGFRNQSA